MMGKALLRTLMPFSASMLTQLVFVAASRPSCRARRLIERMLAALAAGPVGPSRDRGSWRWLLSHRRLLKFYLKMAIDLDEKDEIARARMKMRRLNVEGIAMNHEPFHLSNEAREWNAYLEKQDSRLDSEETGALKWFVDRGKAASVGASAREAATSEPSRYRSRSRSRKQVRLEPAREPVKLLQAPTSSTEPASASVRLTPAPVRLKPVLPHRRRSTSTCWGSKPRSSPIREAVLSFARSST
jgi:hypothetical protein